MANGRIGDQHLIKNDVRPRGGRTEIDPFGGQTGAIGNGGVRQDGFDAIGGDKELERAIVPTAFGPFEPDVIGGVGGDFGGASSINRAVSDLEEVVTGVEVGNKTVGRVVPVDDIVVIDPGVPAGQQVHKETVGIAEGSVDILGSHAI